MKKTLVLVALTFIIINLSAQDDRRRAWIGITLGPSVPVGDFGSTDLKESSGFASTGLNINLVNFGYRFTDNIGVTASWFGCAHELDLPSGAGFTGSWSYGGIMVGPLISIPVSEKVDFNLRPMLGFSTANLEIEGFGSESDSGTAFNMGAGLRVAFANRWGLLANMDYYSQKANIADVDYKINTLNFSLGIAYLFQ